MRSLTMLVLGPDLLVDGNGCRGSAARHRLGGSQARPAGFRAARAGQFRRFACGSNGGPPRPQLSGWADFRRCPRKRADCARPISNTTTNTIHRARGTCSAEVARWAGTTEAGFPVVVSALFNDDGVLKLIRVGPRPSQVPLTSPTNLRKRADAYLFGGLMAARHGIDAARDVCCRRPKARAPSARCSSSSPVN